MKHHAALHYSEVGAAPHRIDSGVVRQDRAFSQALRRGKIDATPHGFRSSFKDWARNHEVEHELSELCLAHVEGSKTVQAYARDDLLEKRRPVMQQWADYLDEGA